MLNCLYINCYAYFVFEYTNLYLCKTIIFCIFIDSDTFYICQIKTLRKPQSNIN